MDNKTQNQTREVNKMIEPRVFARKIAYKLTAEQVKQVSGGKCRGTPEKGDISCDI
jgi:hypothetical protein